MSTAIMLVKAAAAREAGSALGAGLRALGRGGKAVVHGAGELGAGVAHGVGADDAIGRAAGLTALGGGAYVGAKKLKRKKDEWMYQHGFVR